MAKTVQRGRARLEQLSLALGDGDIRQNKKALGVYRDADARHAIVYKIGKTRISCIEMTSGTLKTTTLAESKFFGERRFERVEYPLARAIQNFLNHRGGVSPAALRALRLLMKQRSSG